MCQKKCREDKHVGLLLIEKSDKKHYVLIKDFNTFRYFCILNRGPEHSFGYCLQAFRTADVLKCHIKNCFKINGKQSIKVPKNVNMLDSKIIKEKQNHYL